MTKRDEFANSAMQGLISSIDSEENYQRLKDHAEARGLKLSQWIAKDAYKQADAMVKESQLQQCDIDHMVDRFLLWELPRDFAPDGGISVKVAKDLFTLLGTDLFTAKQARDMILHLLGQDNP